MNTAQVLNFIEAHPRCTAKEAGTTTAALKELEAAGKIENVGVRWTGKKGRPSIEWAMPGVVQPEDQTGRISSGIPGAPSLPDLSPLIPRLGDSDRQVVEYVQRTYERPGSREKADMVLLYNTVQRIVKKVGLVIEAAPEVEEIA